ncbi:MAG: SAM-dependent methyltransferase [Gammaproteobacteria bacterium]|jgi:SAM-dependent methyltransferase
MRFSQNKPKKIKQQKLLSISQWYQTPLGEILSSELKSCLDPVLATTFGYYSIQIGCVLQASALLESCRVKYHFNLDANSNGLDARAHPALLPIASDSVDLVVLMHHLSHTKEPHAILREAFRVLIPEGKLIIIDFNPISFWGLRHFFQSWLEQIPWSGHFYTARRMTDWMKLLGFDKQKHLQVGYMLPIHHVGLISKLSWLEKGMKSWLPFSSALNVLIYSKNISPMTPIRHRWVARNLMLGKVARPSVGRDMKYDK